MRPPSPARRLMAGGFAEGTGLSPQFRVDGTGHWVLGFRV